MENFICPSCNKPTNLPLHRKLRYALAVCPLCASMLVTNSNLELEILTTEGFNALHPEVQNQLNQLVKTICNNRYENKETNQKGS
jgi:ABC-type thiamine transport system ATPase subunit